MNKRITNMLLLALFVPMIVGCNTSNTSSSKNSNSTSSFRDPISTSSSSKVSSSFSTIVLNPNDYALTIPELSTFLQATSYVLEGNETTSATRSTITIEQQAYAIETTIINETLNAYEGPYSIITGTEDITYKSTDTILGDDYEGFQPKSDTYTVFRGKYEDMYYEIDDYGIGKDRDYAAKYSIGKQLFENELPWRTSMQVSYFVDYYIYDLFGTFIDSNYELVPEFVNDGKDLKYSIDFYLPQQDSYGMIYADADFSFIMSMDGFIKEYTYTYVETARDDDGTGTLGEEYLLYSTEDKATVTRGDRQKAPDTYALIPTDYWLQSFDVEIVATLIDEKISCEYDNIPVGYYISAVATNIYPEKALDVNLTILESSNNEAIEVNPYGVVRSLRGGTTTLSIESEGGIQKTLTVSTFEEAIAKIDIKIYSSHLYVGETYNIYEYITPENAVDSITWDTDNHDIATISVDKNGYASLVCHSVGTVTIIGTSVKDSSVSGYLTVKITEKQSEEVLKNLITSGAWNNIETPDDVITFNADGTGTITFKDLISEEVGTFNFNWQFAEYSEDEGLLISITTKVGDYDACFCILSLNGEILEVEFYMQNPDLWFYQYIGDFALLTNEG